MPTEHNYIANGRQVVVDESSPVPGEETSPQEMIAQELAEYRSDAEAEAAPPPKPLPRPKPRRKPKPPAPPPQESFSERLERLQTPDQVEIGGQLNYAEEAGDETGSWAELAEVLRGVKYLVKGWVPYGMLTGVIGQPKAGKSAFLLGGLVGPIVTGGTFFNGLDAGEPGYVVYCDTERSAAINLARAAAWGLPTDRILTPFKNELDPVSLDNEGHVNRLRRVVCKYKARLVVDSFRGAHDGDENNSKIVKPLRALGKLAEYTNAAVMLIHHAGKMTVDEDLTLHCGRGSSAFIAAVRCQLVVDVPDPGSEWRRVQVLGENLGIAPEPVGFRFTGDGLEFGQAPAKPKKQTEEDVAAEWLRQRLKPGQTYPAGEVLEEAEQSGYAERTVRKAATSKLGINPRPVHKDGKIVGWEWVVPGDPGAEARGTS
jgi:hypothetical protein